MAKRKKAAAKSEKPVGVRDRIVELRRVRAGDLRANPKNWRTHPAEQRAAMEGVLAEVGYADALLARETADGSLELVDGHLRQELDPDQVVPVLVLDIDQREADLLLATFDPLAGMAEADDKALGELLAEIETESAAVRAMLDGLAEDNGLGALPVGADGQEFDESCANDVEMTTCPKCGHEYPK